MGAVDGGFDANARVGNPDAKGVAFLVVLGAEKRAVGRFGMLDHVSHKFADNVSQGFRGIGVQVQQRDHLCNESAQLIGSPNLRQGDEPPRWFMFLQDDVRVDPKSSHEAHAHKIAR